MFIVIDIYFYVVNIKFMNVVLFYTCDSEARDAYYITMVPIHMMTLAAFLEKKKVNVTVVNLCRIKSNNMISTILGCKPDVVGTMVFAHNRFQAYKVLSGIKKKSPKIKTVISGPFATFLSGKITDKWTDVDYIVRDETEEAFWKIIKSFKKNDEVTESVHNGGRLDNLKKIPFPAQFSGKMIGVDVNEQFKFVFSSRGMHGANKFFNSPEYRETSIRYRTPDDMVAEIEYIYKNYGIIYFQIRDENFTLRKNKVIEFCRKLRRKKIYPMWNCRSRPEVIDEEMVNEMKLAGLERILLNVKSGSEKLLEQFDYQVNPDDVIRAAKTIRKVGVYLTEYFLAGLPGETKSDINKSKRMIRKTLPGNVVVRNAAYFPGSYVYEGDKLNDLIEEDVWFKEKDSILLINKDKESLKEIKHQLEYTAASVMDKAWYRSKDFKNHRKYNSKKCWVTDILEGDYYLDKERYNDAERCYRKVISAFPDNPWGYLRQGTVKFRLGNFESAEDYFSKVAEIVPSYYGGWLKMAESSIASGSRSRAKRSFQKAYSLNKYDHRISNIKTLLK